jgi:hypothetical protein
MKLARWIPAAALLLVALAFAAIKVENLLPKSGEVKNWNVVAGTLRSAYGIQALFKLYDGDVERMKKYGMKAAAQAMYKNGAEKTMVDVMQLDSAAHAKALYKENTAGIKSIKAVNTSGGGGIMTSASGVTSVYFWRGPIYVNINVFGAKAIDQITAVKFATCVSGHIGKAGL